MHFYKLTYNFEYPVNYWVQITFFNKRYNFEIQSIKLICDTQTTISNCIEPNPPKINNKCWNSLPLHLYQLCFLRN